MEFQKGEVIERAIQDQNTRVLRRTTPAAAAQLSPPFVGVGLLAQHAEVRVFEGMRQQRVPLDLLERIEPVHRLFRGEFALALSHASLRGIDEQIRPPHD